MPISEEDKRKREEARTAYAIEAEIKANEKLLKVIDATIKRREAEKAALLAKGALTDKEIKQVEELTEKLGELEKRHINVTKARQTNIDAAGDNLKKMDEENTKLNKLTSTYDKYSQKILAVAKEIDKSLKSHHGFNQEFQKTIDLTGRFTQNTQQGLDVFKKMRNELNLTRQDGIEFGKVFSGISRLGIDPKKFTQGVKQLQDALGVKEGTAAAGRLARVKVSAPTMAAAMGGDHVAMAKAIRSAGSLEEARDISYLTGGPRSAGAARAARFEAQGKQVEKFKDDIQAGMSAALDLGLGPEIGALALPVAEINANVARIAKGTVGMEGWLKTALMSKGGGADLAKFFGMGGGKGGVGGANPMAALTGTPVGGGGLLSSLPGLGRILAGGAIAAGGVAVGTGMLHYADQEKEGRKKQVLTYGGRAAQAGGIGAGIGMMTAGPLGAAVGGAIGAGVGLVAAAYERNKKAIDDWTTGTVESVTGFLDNMILSEEALKNVDYEKSLLALKTHAEGAGAALDNLANEVANLPEVLEFQIAQSRLPHALASMDPKPMEDYLNKSSKAAAASMLTSSDALKKAMSGVDTSIAGFQGKADAAGARAKAAPEGSKEQEEAIKDQNRWLEGVRSGRSEKAKLEAKIAAQMESINRIPDAAKAMEGVGMRKGFRGMETQAAQVEFETKFAGTGNVEEMGKLQEKINTAYDSNLQDLEKGNNQARQALTETIERAEKEKAGLTIDDARRNVLQNIADSARDALAQQERTFTLEKKELALANQQTNIQTQLNQAMAATETVMFKRSQRSMALAKAQESFARERGAAPGEVGAYAGAQAQEAQTQLSSFMDTFDDRMGKLQEQLKGDVTGPQRMAIEMRIKDLADERVKLESQSLQSRIHAATAEEKQNQELIGISKRVADIQRDTAAKMGMSWQVQMKYQSESIKLSRAEIDSMTTEIAKMTEEIANTPGADPERQVQLQQRKADLAQRQADLIGNVLGKQRTFMESQIANAFGIGGGTKVSPLVNQRLFGPQVQNQLGQRQAVGVGGVMTFEQQQAKRLQDAGMGILGGIGGGVPGPGNAPGLPPGVAIPGKPVAGGVGANGAAGAQGAQQGAGGLDISGKIEIGLNDNLLETRVIRIVQRNFGLPGGNA